jgi:polyferredoxin
MALHPVKSFTVMALVLGSMALILLVPGLLTLVPAVCCWFCDIVVASVFVLHLREEDRQRLEESRNESAEDV